ncbi:ef hand domain containing protein [Niveomyces insectorum RCEF 264]|uniref:Ef hand domain containing protein n=1 Tax=Niveomyces insectorum RCEF 264 TaxID=1081102 RepID=A0A162IE05_9HYPO|nr:ef hand domain containing protein [Niveomyces insectorum RCEF 264]
MASEVSEEAAPNLNLTPSERQAYGQLFRQADTESVGIVMGEVAVKFFEKTRLDSRTLGEIWQIADKENRGFLTPAGFGIALRLIGHAQAGTDPSPRLAFQPGPLPRFEGISSSAGVLPPLPTAATAAADAGAGLLSAQGTGSGAVVPQLAAQGTGGAAAARVPPLSIDKAAQYARVFQDQARGDTVLAGDKAKRIFEKSGLSNDILGRIWQLADTEQRGAFVQTEFIIAMHLLTSTKLGTLRALPTILPAGLYDAATRGVAAAAGGAPIGVALGGPASPVGRQQSPLGGGLGSAGATMPPRQLGTRPPPPNFSSNALVRSAPPAPAAAATTATNATGGDWLITPAEKARMDPVFDSLDKNKDGFITGEEAVPFLTRSGLSEDVLAQIWDLADVKSEGRLTSETFAVALYLIQQQRQRPDGANVLPAKLPPNLVPPSMRSQLRPTSPPAVQRPQQQQQQQQQPPPPPPPLQQLAQSSPQRPPPPPQPKSAMDDLFGLDSGPANLTDPFASGSSPIPPNSPSRSPTIATTSFKPFVPSSSFGRSLTSQVTGDSNSSAPSSISKSTPVPTQAPSNAPPETLPIVASTFSASPNQSDLLGGESDEASRSLSSDTAELANLSNQVGSLSKHMQEVQTHRSTLQTELSQTTIQKKNFEQRLAQLRTLYEKEARDVRTLEEQLKTSRTETKKLQTELAALEASYQDLQTQHQQISTGLQADQQENNSLKERLKAVSAEVSQLKPQIEKLKSEARQHRGIVAINRKQLSLGESERDKLKTEVDDLTRQNEDLARQAHNASVSSAASPSASPSVASASGKNPFFRRTGSTDIMGVFSSPTQAPSPPSLPSLAAASQSFDDVFGPPPTAAVAAPAVVKQQATGTSSGSGVSSSYSAVTAPTSDTATPGTSRQATFAPEVASPPSEPALHQVSSGSSPFGEHTPSAASDTATKAAPTESSPPANASVGLTSPVEHAASPSPSPTAPAAREVSPSATSATNKSASNEELPPSSAAYGGFSFPTATAAAAGGASTVTSTSTGSPDPEKEKATWAQGHAQNDSLNDPFSALDQQQDKAKEDFESAFASFKAARAAGPAPGGGDGASANKSAVPAATTGAATGGPSSKGVDAFNTDANKAFANFNSEFPPISELNRDDESDSDSEGGGGGFDDDFAPASPKANQTLETEGSAAAPAAPAAATSMSGTVGAVASENIASNSTTAGAPSPVLTKTVVSDTSAFTIPTTTAAATGAFGNMDDIFKSPPAVAPPVPEKTSAPAATHEPAPAAPSDDATFDDLEDDFEGLEDAREGSADDDFANISRSGLDDFQSTFDSSPVGKLESRASFGVDSSFDFSNLGGSASTTTAGAGTAVTQNGSGTKAAAADGHDWYSFLGEEQKPTAAAAGTGASASTAGAAGTPAVGAAGSPATAEGGDARPAPAGRLPTDDGTNDDPILQRLTSMGYARSLALNALEKYDYNVDRAANYLANES